MLNKTGRNIFFLGKGGTGKTTIAALMATALADKGKKVALLSMDPAHNLRDVFQIDQIKSIIEIQDNFIIEEIDIRHWTKTYLKSIEKKIANSYQYLTALSLEKHIQTIQFSPGLEEYALQYAFEAINRSYGDFSYRIFDMPPTALALRFFNLPKLTLIWLDQLVDLRKKILERQKIIDSVKQHNQNKSEDKVLNQLLKMRDDSQLMISELQDNQKTGIYIVLNEDRLSISESLDILKVLSEIDFTTKGIFVNKYQKIMETPEIENKLMHLPTFYLPLADISLLGLTRFKEFMMNNEIPVPDF